MKTIRFTTDPDKQPGNIDTLKVDQTSEHQVAQHEQLDDAEAALDAGKYVRKIRKRLGLSQSEFSARIDVPLETIRNWEQGKRSPTGAARSLLKILDMAPDVALAALS